MVYRNQLILCCIKSDLLVPNAPSASATAVVMAAVQDIVGVLLDLCKAL